MAAKSLKKRPPQLRQKRSPHNTHHAAAMGPDADILALHQTAGNRAVNELVAPSQEKPFRIVENTRSRQIADQIGAHGFTWRGDIYLGSMINRPHMPTRREVIDHEIVHVKQTWNPGPYASEHALEHEARSASAADPQLSADPNQVLGLWWVVPLAVGAYILLRPKVANAPGPGDPVYESPSDFQIVGEALSLFAVPGGIASGLGRMGYGVVSAYAVSGAAASVSFRGVQDIGAGQFSGIDAYILDATTGAVIGVVIGGAVRVFAGSSVVTPTTQSTPSLIHLTDEAGRVGIRSSNVLRGSQGIYAIPSKAATEGMARRFLRTLVAPSRTRQVISVPDESLGLFSRPDAIGPVSLYQRLAGVYRAPAGQINLASGAFTPSGHQFANITGQFWPYGVDSMIWLGAGTASGITLSHSSTESGARERGLYEPLYDVVAQQPPLPMTERRDGPFIFLQEQTGGASSLAPTARPSREQPRITLSTGATVPSELVLDPSIFQGMSPEQLQAGGGRNGRVPAVIFVAPDRLGLQSDRQRG